MKGRGVKLIKVAVVVIVLVFGAIFLWGKFYGKESVPRESYKLATVKKGDIRSLVTSTGKITPVNTVKVGAQVSGNVKELYADFNTTVKKDQIIALIDPAVYAAQVGQSKAQLTRAEIDLKESRHEIAVAEAGIKSADAQLLATQATFKEAELSYNRKKWLGEMVAPAELDAALAKRDNANSAVGVAEARTQTARIQLKQALTKKEDATAQIAERKASLDLAEIKLQYCTIRSPINGVIISREVDVGQTLASSLQSPLLFTIAEDLTRMQVEVDVSEADVGRIQPGQAVVFTVDAFPEKNFTANVREARNVANSIQNVVTYKIIADVANNDLLLRPGMTANVNIVTDEVKNVLKVPNGALRFKPQATEPEEKPGEKPEKETPVRERALFKNAVKKIELDAGQADALVKIIEQAGQKLKAAYSLPEADRDLKQAWKSFYTQVFTDMYKLLREDQHGKFKIFVADIREKAKQQNQNKGRPARIYVLNKNGQPQAVKITAGITNDDETQILAGKLTEGEKVIVGIEYAADKQPVNANGSIFSSFFKRR